MFEKYLTFLHIKSVQTGGTELTLAIMECKKRLYNSLFLEIPSWLSISSNTGNKTMVSEKYSIAKFI